MLADLLSYFLSHYLILGFGMRRENRRIVRFLLFIIVINGFYICCSTCVHYLIQQLSLLYSIVANNGFVLQRIIILRRHIFQIQNTGTVQLQIVLRSFMILYLLQILSVYANALRISFHIWASNCIGILSTDASIFFHSFNSLLRNWYFNTGFSTIFKVRSRLKILFSKRSSWRLGSENKFAIVTHV